jgi:hypothetical protein
VAGADPVGEHRRPQPPSAAAGAHSLRSPRPDSWSCRGAGVPPARQGGDRGFKSRQDRSSSSGETEITTDFESVVGGSSPPGSTSLVSSMGERPSHKREADGPIPSLGTVGMAQRQSAGLWAQRYRFNPGYPPDPWVGQAVSPAGRNPVASAWRFDSSLTDQALVVQGIACAAPDREMSVRIGPRVPWRGSRRCGRWPATPSWPVRPRPASPIGLWPRWTGQPSPKGKDGGSSPPRPAWCSRCGRESAVTRVIKGTS